MNHNELAFVDLSSLGHPIFAMSSKEPDPDHASQQIVTAVRTLTSQHPHAAICLDMPPYLRKTMDPSYKANRPVSDAPLLHQIRLAVEQLKADGYPVWGVRGYEADDIIASATARALALDPDLTVLIISADKDLLQLVGPRVKAKSTKTGDVLDEAAVLAKFGVKPSQMHDYLCLVGDVSDNIKGCNKVGPKGAADLLAAHGSIERIFKVLNDGVTNGELPFTPALAKNLADFSERYRMVSDLVTLSAKVEIPFEEIAAERPAPQLAPDGPLDHVRVQVGDGPTGITMEEMALPPTEPEASPITGAPAHTQDRAAAPVVALAAPADIVHVPQIVQQWERQLDPRDRLDARALAIDMFASRLFSGFGNAPACLAAIMMGRELGMSAIASLRGIHVIEGRPSLSAALMVALVLRSGLAEYFEPVSMSETEVTFVTKRKGARKEVTLTHTIEMAHQAGLVKAGSGWVKNPVDMLVARAQSRLARLIYPDLLAGLYSVEEVEEFSRAA